MIGRRHHVVIDCPEPAALVAFYSELIGLPVSYRSDDWVVIAETETASGFAFQLAPDHRPPQWPDPERPQQIHLDVMVDELAVAEPGCWRSAHDNCPREITCTPTQPVIPSA